MRSHTTSLALFLPKQTMNWCGAKVLVFAACLGCLLEGRRRRTVTSMTLASSVMSARSTLLFQPINIFYCTICVGVLDHLCGAGSVLHVEGLPQKNKQGQKVVSTLYFVMVFTELDLIPHNPSTLTFDSWSHTGKLAKFPWFYALYCDWVSITAANTMFP